MSYQDHLKTCSYCNKDSQKPTVRIKAASSYRREKKLAELGALVAGISYPGISYVGARETNATKAKSASRVEKSQKLMELGKLIRG
jgi:hypothetical protein